MRCSVVLCAVLFAACAPRGPVVPHVRLDAELEPLRARFNQAAETARILMLVAPSCGVCLRGVSTVHRKVMGERGRPLHALVVWVPMEATETDVPEATRFLSDARASHYWDEGGRAMAKFTALLGLQEDAWDVYLVYGPGVRWEGDTPPRPSYWMHQLGSPDRPRVAGPYLDGDVLRERTASLIAKQGLPSLP